MKNKTSKTLVIIAALAIVSSTFMNLHVYAEDGFFEEIFFDDAATESIDDTGSLMVNEKSASVTDSYSVAQKSVYDKITAACDDFLNSSVSLSTNAFKIVTLDSAVSMNDIGTVVSDIKKSGTYPVLNRIGLYSSAGNTSYDKITLFTKEEYRTAAGREKIKVKLEITSQPTDANVSVGEKAEFTVIATGSGLTYQWQYSKDGGATWLNTSNKTSKYTLSVAGKYLNGYMYRCVVTDENNNSVTSEAGKVIIAKSLSIISQPTDANVSVGEKAEFTVTATGNGLTYQWQYSKDGGATWLNTSNKTSKYTLSVAGKYLNGYMYRCVVTDENNNSVTSEAGKVIIAKSLSIISQPTDANVSVGEKAEFTVTATGNGLTYQWQYSKDGGATWLNTSNKTSKYTLSVAGKYLNGYMYRCVVTDENNNSVTSEAGKVIIAESLSITSQPTDANVSVGEKAEFTVTATGSGLTYRWQYSKDGGATWLNTSNKTSKYTLSVAGKYLNGYMYRCVVTDENNNSVTSEAGKVIIAESLSITSQPTDANVSVGEKAEFTVTATGSGLTYRWQYSKDGGATWLNTSNKTSKYTLSVAGKYLNGYMYRCVVTDENNNSVTSEAGKVIIAESLSITSQPTDANVSVGEKAEFTVTATGSGLTYQWQYSKDGGATWLNTSNKTSKYTLSVAGKYLNGYMYRCVVTDENNNSVTSEAVKVVII